MPKRILLMYISEVSGHHKATLAIENAIRRLSTNVEVANINGFNYINPFLEKIVNKTYMGLIKKTPGIWGYLYDNPKVVKITQRIKDKIHESNYWRLRLLFERLNPDVIVSTQAFPCGMVADYKKAFNVRTPLVGVLTDYAPHAYWVYREVNYYIVASEEAKKRFIKEGVPEDNIKLFGIPIDHKFTKFYEKGKLAEKLGINSTLPTILIMGGSRGLGPMKQIVNGLNALDTDFQVIIVAGTNKALSRWLKKRQSTNKKKTIIFKYTSDIDKIMELSKFVITKPGGLTTAEALAKGLPMIIIKPIPGQEMNNTEYLLKKGAAIKVDNTKELNIEVKGLLENQRRLFEMSMAAKEISKPEAAINIANLLLSINA
ncbi:MAG: hypothetical protein ISS47_08390 [Candidatus Omnitrophica bacterium]|nr:hypothetical protein [Candidatus Omnitrophota bacterium]